MVYRLLSVKLINLFRKSRDISFGFYNDDMFKCFISVRRVAFLPDF